MASPRFSATQPEAFSNWLRAAPSPVPEGHSSGQYGDKAMEAQAVWFKFRSRGFKEIPALHFPAPRFPHLHVRHKRTPVQSFGVT